MNDNNFKFFLPADIEKAKNGEGIEIMRVKGIASTANTDSQNEALSPSGMDLKDFKWINWNHHGSKDPSTIIGEPTKAEVTAKNELYIEGVLYPEVPMAKTVWSLMKALQNSPAGNKLCLSVEGKVTERGCGPEFLDIEKTMKNPNFSPEKWGKIVKSKITGVAICPVPVNGDTWVDFIKKGYTSEEEEVYDKETLSLLDNNQEGGLVKEPLKKSEIFEKIYDKFPDITIEKAKSVYNLIEKTAKTMKTGETVSNETITKAFEILELATAASTNETINKSEDADNDSDDDGEMVEKASNIYKAMSAESKDSETIKAALLKKGYGEKVIEKAMACKEETKDVVSKSEIAELLKSHTDNISKAFDVKMEAVSTILKNQMDINDELQKSLDDTLSKNEELNSKMEGLLKQPLDRKSVIITKSFQDKFGDAAKEEGASKKYNILNSTDRKALRDKVTEMSGINKGENFDSRLTNVAQELEISQTLSPQSASLLKSMDIEVLGVN